MNMEITKIYLGLLVIFFINGQAEPGGVSRFTVLIEAFEWGHKLHNTAKGHLGAHPHAENFAAIQKQLDRLSAQTKNIFDDLDMKLDDMLVKLIDNMELQAGIQHATTEIGNCKNEIQSHYDKSKTHIFPSNQIVIKSAYANDTINAFINAALWGEMSVRNSLRSIYDTFTTGEHETIFAGFLSTILKLAAENLQHHCDDSMSTQQRMFNIYEQLIIDEMIGCATLFQVYTTKQILSNSSHDYFPEMQFAVGEYQKHVEGYHKLFRSRLAYFPRQIRRCDPSPSKRGIDFVEFVFFSRLVFSKKIDEDLFTTCNSCGTLGTTGFDCQRFRGPITYCPAENDSSRETLWWKDGNDEMYGHNESCAATKTMPLETIMEGYGAITSTRLVHCILCVCSVDQPSSHDSPHPTLSQISVTEQISDIQNNMVVTGIKFIVKDKVLHLQIRQTKFSSQAVKNYTEWKDVDVQYNTDGKAEIMTKMNTVEMNHNRKTIYLDDIKVPTKNVITGVRLQLVGDGTAFALHVHATKFDFKRGKLRPPGDWYDSNLHPMRKHLYERERLEIIMNEPDDPARGSNFHFDLSSNKKIKIIHSDGKKDAGQSTIPYIDAQPVETNPPFPLDGLGLHFRGTNGFGGFISPLIYTADVTPYLKPPPRKVVSA